MRKQDTPDWGRLPCLVVADTAGDIFEIPELKMSGMEWGNLYLPDPDEIIPLPEGSNLFMLPERVPLGYLPEKETIVEVPTYRGEKVHAVAAFMAPAYLQHYTAAFIENGKKEGAGKKQGRRSTTPSPLPLFSYTAAGWDKGQFMVPGERIDADTRQDIREVDPQAIEEGAVNALKRYPDNRLVEHLVENCVRRYCCPAARNFVLGRWECPAPTSPACNADCAGCISYQHPETGTPATQDRIDFLPTPEEIAEFSVPHLENAPRPVVSFGQGCEGEPLLAGELIREAIRLIRSRTNRGIINLNTNGSKPEVVKQLFQSGLDSIRVSMNSCREGPYTAYYRPRDYSFSDVLASISLGRELGKWTSINYFMFPGFTDTPPETRALASLIRSSGLHMIQTRNLNMDPYRYMECLGEEAVSDERPLGVGGWVEEIRREFPRVMLGYFNPPAEEMRRYGHFAK
jgi:pyruvate-formate lyase-activating enzyme